MSTTNYPNTKKTVDNAVDGGLEIYVTYRARFWDAVVSYAEVRWLKAHGWIHTSKGWLLPVWHPKASAQSLDHALARGYDTSHAINSQRIHGAKRKVDSTLPHPSHVSPAFPSYTTMKPFQACSMSLGVGLIGVAVLMHTSWLCWIFVTAGLTLLVASFVIAVKSRRDWMLDWAEDQLLKGSRNEAHDRN